MIHLLVLFQAIECHMLKITYFLNYKKGNTLTDIRGDVTELVYRLTKVSKIAIFLKPRLYLLKAYMCVIRSQTNRARRLIGLAKKTARCQGSLLVQASIEIHKIVSNSHQFLCYLTISFFCFLTFFRPGWTITQFPTHIGLKFQVREKGETGTTYIIYQTMTTWQLCTVFQSRKTVFKSSHCVQNQLKLDCLSISYSSGIQLYIRIKK